MADWHPKVADDVYYQGMDWLCPSFNEKLAAELKSFYGNITAANAIKVCVCSLVPLLSSVLFLLWLWF